MALGMLMQRLKLAPSAIGKALPGAVSGNTVNIRAYDRIGIFVHIKQGNAAQTTITVDKHTSVAKANTVTGIMLNNWWFITDSFVLCDDGTPCTRWQQGTAAASIVTSATGTGESAYYIEVKGSELVSGNSAFGLQYACVTLQVSASNASNVVSSLYLAYPARYSGSAIVMPCPLCD